jgi:hypothetical protein
MMKCKAKQAEQTSESTLSRTSLPKRSFPAAHRDQPHLEPQQVRLQLPRPLGCLLRLRLSPFPRFPS